MWLRAPSSELYTQQKRIKTNRLFACPRYVVAVVKNEAQSANCSVAQAQSEMRHCWCQIVGRQFWYRVSLSNLQVKLAFLVEGKQFRYVTFYAWNIMHRAINRADSSWDRLSASNWGVSVQFQGSPCSQSGTGPASLRVPLPSIVLPMQGVQQARTARCMKILIQSVRRCCPILTKNGTCRRTLVQLPNTRFNNNPFGGL